MKDWQVYTGAALFGVLAGMRSMAAPAAIGQAARKGALKNLPNALQIIGAPKFGPTTSILAAAEAIADKLPFIPNRTAAGPLLGRALAGGVSGALVCSAQKKSPWFGGLLGAGAAVGAAYGAYALRKRAGELLRLPDPVIAIAEDALVGTLGYQLVSRFESISA